jgi:hypothetical protein
MFITFLQQVIPFQKAVALLHLNTILVEFKKYV